MKIKRTYHRICLGYPSGNGCTKVAGGRWSPYWCPECDTRRVDHITAQLEKIAATMKPPPVTR